MDAVLVFSFLGFTGLVGVLTWLITRRDDHRSSQGYFLAGRSLTFPLIAGSLLLTNLSAEQVVGLNSDAYRDGLAVMVWEVFCVIALVFMAWFFLPRFLKSGVTTVPEYLGLRYDQQTQTICSFIFLFAYVAILLPIVLYAGAVGLRGMLDVPGLLRDGVERLGVEDTSGWDFDTISLWVIVWTVGVIGSIYALFGGLRTVAVSDTLNGIGLLVGGFLITAFAFYRLGDENVWTGIHRFWVEERPRLNSIGDNSTTVPFSTIFSGIFLLHLFYWTTNQQIIQRTLGAKSLAEGQKGVLLTGALKLLGPLYLVIPGMIAYKLFEGQSVSPDDSYGLLVRTVLPRYLTGFFAAVMIGAILSSFNSALNSACTLFSLGVYKPLSRPDASDHQVVSAGALFGLIVAIVVMTIAPFLETLKETAGAGIFGYLQKMNGMYFIPIFAVVLVGMLSRRVPPMAAKIALVGGITLIGLGYFEPHMNLVVKSMHEFHFLGIVFLWLVVMMFVVGEIAPRSKEFIQQDVGAVDMRPWRHARLAGFVLIGTVISIYLFFADFRVLAPPQPSAAVITETEDGEAVPRETATPDVVAPDLTLTPEASRGNADLSRPNPSANSSNDETSNDDPPSPPATP